MSAKNLLRLHGEGVAMLGGHGARPPIEDPHWDATAEAIGEALLHERTQVPPVVLGQCEEDILSPWWIRGVQQVLRCRSLGILCAIDPGGDRFLCPRHGATLERAVRRYPR